MEHLFAGIDLGTSAMKLALIDGKKRVLAQVTRNYEAAQPACGFSEIDPEIWYGCLEEGLELLLKGIDRERVEAVGVTGQMHTLVTLGEDGNPVRPAIMWNDTRTRELIPELRAKMRQFKEGEYLARTISTGSPAANLFWMSRYERENFKRIRKFLIGPDYLVYRLTGRASTDFCEASTSCLYCLGDKYWSEEMRELLGLSPSMYPEVRGSAQTAGTLTEEAAARFGLRKTVRVIVGTGDNPAAAISTGCLGRGYPVISLGTSGVFMMAVPRMRENVRGKMILFSFDGREYSYLVQGAVQSNGSTLNWWMQDVLGAENYAGEEARIDPEKAAESQVLFYPHLMGDKTIHADPDIRGAFIGLGADTGREQLTYAVIEGLCFSFRQLAEEMKLPLGQFKSVKAVGGGAKSRLWLQTLANVLEMDIEQVDGNVGPAFGIALLAAYSGGFLPSTDSLSDENVRIRGYFKPNPRAAEACRAKYRRYLRIYESLKLITEENSRSGGGWR